ncbi:hypothetical protein KP005_14215 [Geomonas nitrogeniifigens]|uniref:Lipoprotein n=1 Tax=Geomonas diazotrophica TaxID=2843197 RepID=A0ABX8JDQ0_9BACT|nr:hypothetical protein [Geomonas nitrogeniifigens]QWV96520.1 hypothetical protein KP005_14215 [Geomonas nitrogeniifigens]
MMRKLVFHLWLVLATAIAAGCSAESKVPGSWAGSTGTIVLKKDHKGTISPPAGSKLPSDVPLVWKMQGDDLVQLDIGAPVGQTYVGRLIDDRTFSLEGGKFVKQK